MTNNKIVYLALINFDIGERITKVLNTKQEAIKFCKDTLKEGGFEDAPGIECLVFKCKESDIGHKVNFAEADVVWSQGVIGLDIKPKKGKKK